MKRLTDPLRGIRQARPSRVAPVRRSGLTDMQANILQALREAGKELIAKQIAPLAGHKNDGYFRGVLRGLLRDGYLQRGPNGYRLPD